MPDTPSCFWMWVWISANDSPSLAWKPRHAGMDHAGRSRRSFPAPGSLPQAPIHPQNASSKAPASCQVKPDTDFPESSIWFWGKVWMNQADENKRAVRCQELVSPNHASLAGWLLAWVMRPYRKQEQKGRCVIFKQLNFLSISSYWWDAFSDVGCHKYPKFLFPKAHLWGNIDVLTRADHSPRRSWSKFTVGLKLVTLCVANDIVYFWQQCDIHEHYLILLPG